MKEEWKDIDDFEGNYQISSRGRVRSLDRYIVNSKKVRRFYKGRVLKTFINSKKYESIKVDYKGSSKFLLIHILVATYFIENPENKPQVNHIDGNPSNNSISNLEWVTSSENMKHAYNTGLQKPVKGDKNTLSKLTEKQVDEIRYLCNNKLMKQYEIAIKFKVSNSLVSMIKTGKKRIIDEK